MPPPCASLAGSVAHPHVPSQMVMSLLRPARLRRAALLTFALAAPAAVVSGARALGHPDVLLHTDLGTRSRQSIEHDQANDEERGDCVEQRASGKVPLLRRISMNTR